MNSYSNKDKHPLTPQQMFQRLMGQDCSRMECTDESIRISQQKTVLQQLVWEYQEEIKRLYSQLEQDAYLAKYKAELLLELQKLKEERDSIEKHAATSIEIARLTPAELRQRNEWILELNEVRTTNNRMRLKIKDMAEYVSKLEAHNNQLEQQKMALQINQVPKLQVDDGWRYKMEALKSAQTKYEHDFQRRLEEQEKLISRSVQAQEFEIMERNKMHRQHQWNGVNRPQRPAYDRFRII